MLGSATLTIETSSRVMNPAARQTPSAIQRSGSGRYPSPGGAGAAGAAEATDRGSPTPAPIDSAAGVAVASCADSDGGCPPPLWLTSGCRGGAHLNLRERSLERQHMSAVRARSQRASTASTVLSNAFTKPRLPTV